MKRIALYLIALCMLASCREKVDNSIKYGGGESVNIVLLEELKLNATTESDNPITYYSDNDMVVTVNSEGVIKGKNVGMANVTISNTIDVITVKVTVSLYEEPTTDFYVSKDEISKIYGQPNYIVDSGDTTVYIYGSGNDWYSYAVWEMDFFFIDDQYIESDLYIRSDVETRLDEFLNNNYYYQRSDTINDEIYYIYLNEENPEDATVMLGKINNVGQYEDICVFYIPYEYEEKFDYKGIIRKKLRI
ncbi:MAG: hypothetical protein IJE47_10045 [Bacteroidales bacterium]|nr:hypothetical protein [Bacteroidales bacterium]